MLQAIDWALIPAEEMRPQTVAELRAVLAAVGPVPGSDSPTVVAGPQPDYRPSPRQPVSATYSPPDGEALKKIEALLATHIGPIAAVTVRRAARNAASTQELVETVADESKHGAGREKRSPLERLAQQPDQEPFYFNQRHDAHETTVLYASFSAREPFVARRSAIIVALKTRRIARLQIASAASRPGNS